MTTYTNKYRLPQYLVDWLLSSGYDFNYDPNTISTTTLLKPIKAQILGSRYTEDVETDVSELIAARYGTAIHDSVEKIETPGVSKEVRLHRQIQIEDTVYTVSGKYDILVDLGHGTYQLQDMKSTSVWSYIYGGKDEDYRKQLSIYRWLLSPTHQVIDQSSITFFFTDWSSSKARQDQDYPKLRIQSGYKVDLWSLEQTEQYIRERLTLFHLARQADDDELPDCTPEELWQTEDSWAVYKDGNKKATKLCNTEEEAELYKISKKIKGNIQHRPGKVKRCRYCSSFPVCDQGQAYQANNQIEF